jgi:folate-binding protein YgfZ
MNPVEALDELHQKAGANFSFFDRLAVVEKYSIGIEQELRYLQKSSGIFDRKAWLLLELNGVDAKNFLQGMVSADLDKIDINQIQPALICQSKGKIQHVLEIWRTSQHRWVLSSYPGEGFQVANLLDKFHIRENFEFQLLTPSFLRLDLRGPRSRNVLEFLGLNGLSTTSDTSLVDKKILCTKHQHLGVEHYSLLIPGKEIENVANNLLDQEDCGWVGWKAWNEMDLIERIPVFGRDYTNDNFAQEAALKDYISFNKGCYIGQEPNARLFFRGRPQKQLVSLSIPASVATLDASTLFSGSELVGEITSISASSHDGTYLGMAMVKTKVLDTEDTMLSIMPDDPEPSIEWSKLPTHIMR